MGRVRNVPAIAIGGDCGKCRASFRSATTRDLPLRIDLHQVPVPVLFRRMVPYRRTSAGSRSSNMSATKRLWIVLGTILVASFTALGLVGREIYNMAPPIPRAVQSRPTEPFSTRVTTSRRARGLAEHRRAPARLDPRARGLRRAGLDGRLRCTARRSRCWTCRARREYGREYAQLDTSQQAALQRRAARRAEAEHLRPGDRDA
jgi:hypothetical protein